MMELLIVLLIGSLAVGLLVPRMGAGWNRMKDRDFIDAFVREMKRARFTAMQTGRPAVFGIDPAAKTFGAGAEPDEPIPGNLDIFSDDLEQDAATGNYAMTFHSDGSIDGGDIDLIFDDERKYVVKVDRVLGLIASVRGDGEVDD